VVTWHQLKFSRCDDGWVLALKVARLCPMGVIKG
jgi:hypothetical protein